jgi:hypothetical protein
MAELTADVTADETLLPVDEAPPGPDTFFTVDDESIRVIGSTNRVPGPQLHWLVERGVGGTTAAAHDSGATLTRYYPEAPSSGGGAMQQVSLLGPFRVSHDDAGVTTAVVLTTLPVGVLVLSTHIVIVERWLVEAEGLPVGGLVGIAEAATPAQYADLHYSDELETAAAFEGIITTAPYFGAGGSSRVSSRSAFTDTMTAPVLVFAADDATVQGEADVYALIAEPAA